MGAPEFIAPSALSSADSLLQAQWVRERLDATSSSDAFPRAQLRLALQEQRLRVAYQPILRLDDLQTMGQEALARLLTPQGRVVTAEAFIGTAAKLGIEPRIDAAITSQAMAACQPVPFAAAPGKLFLNCSSAFLAEPSCMDKLARQHQHWLQKQSGADTSQTPWVLEITERNLDSDPARLLANLKPLLNLGFELALDDFGSNHSAFPYLLALPIRYLKLDRSLVRTGMHTTKGEHVLRHLLQLAQDLNLITIAEGVESQTALHWLRGIGVHWGQGFFWGQPTSMQAAQ